MKRNKNLKLNHLVGVVGKKQSGKDTFYRILKHLLLDRFDILYENKKFADNVKLFSSILTGLPIDYFYDVAYYTNYLPEWKMNIREFQQKLGTDAIRNNFHPNAWVNSLMYKFYGQERWVITDVRFPNEADIIKDYKGVLVRIIRDNHDGDTHESETAMNDYDKYDYIIDNNGTIEHFTEQINEFIDKIMIEK